MKKEIIALLIAASFLMSGCGKSPSSLNTITPPNATASSPLSETTTTTAIRLENGEQFTLSHPDNYTLSVATEGYRHLRFMAMSPDNRLFVGEMYDASDTSKGHVYVFDNFDETTKRFNGEHVYLANLRNPHSLAFYTDPTGKTWLYIALTDKLIRYTYSAGDTAPSSKPETIATFPDYGQPRSAGGWHITRTIVFHNNKLYVSVGSSCNSCEEKASEPERASILIMNPDGSNPQVFASGLRNAVGLTFVGSALIATNNNADHLGKDRPVDDVYEILAGKNYGWPYCYEYDKRILADDAKNWQQKFDCSNVPRADIELPAHSAPLGITYFDNVLLIALHGSGDKTIQTGYEVIAADYQGKQVPFLTGFQKDTTVYGRPVGILPRNDRSLFVTDDLNGAIYYLEKK